MSAMVCSAGFCSASYNRAASVQLTTACSKFPRWNQFNTCSICFAAGEVSATAANAGFAVENKGPPMKFRKRPRPNARLYLSQGRQGRLILGDLPKTQGDAYLFPGVRGALIYWSFIFSPIAGA